MSSPRRGRRPARADPPRIGALLRHAWQEVRLRIYRGVQAEGYDDLTAAHVALFRYESIDGRRPTQVAEQMQVTKQSVNDLLRHLERGRYIELRPDPADGRARQIRLTARGKRLDAAVRTQARRAEQEILKSVGSERFGIFRETLIEITRSQGRNEADPT